MDKIIKIDRVASLEEAKAFENLGVNIMSISLSEDFRFRDQRTLSEREALVIKDALDNRTKLVGEISFQDKSTNWLDTINRVEFDFIQPIGRGSLSQENRSELRRAGTGLIYSFLEASYDDDPSWLLGDFTKEEIAGVAFFQLDLIPDMEDSWRFFKEECPKLPDELQLSDINALAFDSPILVTSNFSKQNINEVFELLPNIRGISLVLTDDPDGNDIHCFSYKEALDLLAVLMKN